MLNFSEEEWERYRKAHRISEEGKKIPAPLPKQGKRTVKEPAHIKEDIVTEDLVKLTETEIQNQIRAYLRMNGWYVIRHQQSLGSLKGLSDLTAIKNGLTIYIEVKTPRGVQSKYQKEFQDEIESHGGKYFLVKSVNEMQKINASLFS